MFSRPPRFPGCPHVSLLGVLALCVAATRAPAAPVMLNAEGQYKDCFEDGAGLEFRQNVRIGPSLVHGVRVSLGNWSWAQSYTQTGDVLSTPFDAPGASLNLTQVNPNGASPWKTVSLWSKTYLVARDLVLDPGAGTTTYFGPWANAVPPLAVLAPLELFNGRRVVAGPYQTGLLPNHFYTATLETLYCNSPDCKSGPDISGALAGTYDVVYGATAPAGLAAIDVILGGAGGTPPGNFAFSGEGQQSPYTLEWQVPTPLPPGSGWEYRFKASLTTTGSVNCSPACTASLWLDTITVMAMGKPIAPLQYDSGGCGAGLKPAPCVPNCAPVCMLDTLPCGWDTASWFIDSGSYVSPVFDSLSDQTVWQSIWWNTDQGYSGTGVAGEGIGWPSTPVGIKWRVGNSPDPATWLPNPAWYTWTVPMTVTCTGERADDCRTPGTCAGSSLCNCQNQPREAQFLCPPVYPPPIDAIGTAPLYADGKSALAVGRYFQYEVDFTSRFANASYPVDGDGRRREYHPNTSGLLKGFRAYYLPARGEVRSNAITPTQLFKWRVAKYETEVSTGGSVEVDVLDANNIPLFTNIPSGFSLAGLDPAAYPTLKLRAHVNNLGINTVRPALLCWELDWDTFTEPLQLNRNSLDTVRGEVVDMTVVIVSARPGTLTVHDAAGQSVRKFFEGVFLPGVLKFRWDGTNARGERVAPGVYFVSLKAKEIRRSRTIAVLR